MTFKNISCKKVYIRNKHNIFFDNLIVGGGGREKSNLIDIRKMVDFCANSKIS